MTSNADTHACSAAADLGEWAELIRRDFVALDIAPTDKTGGFVGSVRQRALGTFTASRVQSVPQTFSRSARMISRSPASLFQVGMVVAGGGILSQDGRSCSLGPGDFAIYETERPFHWTLEGDWDLRVFTWNRSAITLDEAESQRVTATLLRGDSGVTGVLSRTLSGIYDLGVDLPPTSAVRFADELAALTVTAVLAGDDPISTPSEGDLARRVVQYIEDNLDDPQLGPQGIAEHFFISTRTLHRLFAREGETVAQRVRTRRLEKCRQALIAEPGTRVSTIMMRYGFVDLAAFSRNFHARYGASPTEFRARYR